MTNDQMGPASIVVLVLIVLSVPIIVIAFLARRKTKTVEAAAKAGSYEIARIEETVSYAGGGFALLMMVLFNVTAIYGYYTSTTVFQQIAAELGAISASTFWGVVAMMNRRSVYRVLRDPDLARPPA